VRSYGFTELMNVYRRVKKLFIFTVVLLVLAGAGTVAKNVILNQLKREIQKNFGYTRLFLNLVPPSIVLEDARSVSLSPFFSAKKVAVSISYRSLLSREKPLIVLIESPVLRVYPSGEEAEEPSDIQLIFPFEIDRAIIRNGELYYWGREARIQSKGIHASLTQNRDRFTLNAEIEQNDFLLGSAQQRIGGKISLSLEGQGESFQIKKAKISSPKGIFKASGQVSNLANPVLELNTSFNIPIDVILQYVDLPFEWDGKVLGEGLLSRRDGQMAFEGTLSSNTLRLNETPMGNVRGEINYSQNSGGNLDINFQKANLPQEYVGIRFYGGRVDGLARGFYLDPIMNYLDIPWPISSPVWGNFSVFQGKFEADIDFRDEVDSPDLEGYFLRGRVNLTLLDEVVTLTSQNLDSNLAKVDVQGVIAIGGDVDVLIDGDVKNVKLTRQLLSIILRKSFDFPEIRGQGQGVVRIFGDFAHPQVSATVSLSPGGFDTFDVESVNGDIEIYQENFQGIFDVDDPAMKGRINLVSNPSRVKAKIQLDEGLAEKILPNLDIVIPLEGVATGEFEFEQEGEQIRVFGGFFGQKMSFLGQTAVQVKGTFDWEEDRLNFSDLQFGMFGGQVQGTALLRLLSREFQMDFTTTDVDLTALYPALQGKLSFKLKGGGAFGQDYALGPFEIKDLFLEPFQKTEASGEVKLSFTEDHLDLKVEGSFLPGENPFSVSLGIPLLEETLNGDISGSFTNPDILMPWSGARMEIGYIAEMNGLKTSPQIRGAVDVQGTVLPFPNFAHAFRDFSALASFNGSDVTIRSFQGKFGGGNVQGSGTLVVGIGGVEEIDVSGEGENMQLALLERTRALADGTIRLIKNADRFELIGDFYAHRVLWRRELEEKFAFSTTSLYSPRKEPTFFDDLNLNIRLRADDDAWMENTLGNIRGKFDLMVTGNILSPIVMGEIEALEGEVYFQDREFRILTGKVSFINPARIEPYITFTGETYVKDYRVTFSLDGLMESLNPNFSSSPPLPPEDVLALLAMGEAFKRTYQYDRSTQLSTGSLLSFQLSEQAKKSAEGIFSIDRFRIDPYTIGASSSVTARLTVGKKISKNVFMLYSTNLTAQREDIVRIEWELTNDISVVGTRDEEGRVSLDVKIHKRF
jgi:hypothetical protein